MPINSGEGPILSFCISVDYYNFFAARAALVKMTAQETKKKEESAELTQDFKTVE